MDAKSTNSVAGGSPSRPDVAVLIPCYNEELTVGKVIDDFRRALPEARIIVFDNCSTDRTATLAAEHGATVLRECRQGKGFVVESMFDRIKADAYVMVDGDDTYPAEKVHELLAPILAEDADMVVGSRLETHAAASFRPLHVAGNNLVRALVNLPTHSHLKDIMSGYRAFSRRLVDRLPVVASGFDIETEMTVQAVYYQMKIVEVPVAYGERPTGSESKLSTFRDGFLVLWKIFGLFRSLKPLTFFGSIGLLCCAAGLLAGVLPIHDYLTEPGHYVRHVPLGILASALMIIALGNISLGILLHTLNWRLRELHSVLIRRR